MSLDIKYLDFIIMRESVALYLSFASMNIPDISLQSLQASEVWLLTHFNNT
jgi:hypothetical protein